MLIGNPFLTKTNDLSLSCSFVAQYTTLPLSIPDAGTPAYKLLVFLTCQKVNAFDGYSGPPLVFETQQDPPPTDLLTGTVTLPSVVINPPVTYVTTGLILQGYRTGLIQTQEDFDFQNVTVP
jgi:hypothetical protein